MSRTAIAADLRRAATGDRDARDLYLRLASSGLVSAEAAADYLRRARECTASCGRNLAAARELAPRRPSEPRPAVGRI